MRAKHFKGGVSRYGVRCPEALPPRGEVGFQPAGADAGAFQFGGHPLLLALLAG
jgi:hypothetical protein